jgi:ABC-type transport system involved in cytochrome c biogenesis permease subunit
MCGGRERFPLLAGPGGYNPCVVQRITVYGGASVVGLRVVTGRRRGRALRPMLWVGVAVLTAFLAAAAFHRGDLPILYRHEVLAVAAWALGLGSAYMSRRLSRVVIAAVAAPTLALLTFFALLLVPSASGDRSASGIGIASHIILAILGFAGFSVSAGVGALYLWQIRLLKRDPTAAVSGRMPALEKLDRLNFLAAAAGFPCLALGLLAGWLFLGEGRRWWVDPTFLTSLGGLLVYTLLFTARGFLGWYGRRIAWLSVIGFCVAVGGYVVAAFCTSESTTHASAPGHEVPALEASGDATGRGKGPA